MVKTTEMNKSEAVRDILRRMPNAWPTEIARMLAEQGIQVTAGFASTVKSDFKKSQKSGTEKKAAPTAAPAKPANDTISVSTLVQAKKLADQLGGVEKAKRAIDALEKLQ